MHRFVVTRDGFKCDMPICFWDIDLEDKLTYNDDGMWMMAEEDGHIPEQDMSYPQFQKHYGGMHLEPGGKRVMIEQYSWEGDDFDTKGIVYYISGEDK